MNGVEEIIRTWWLTKWVDLCTEREFLSKMKSVTQVDEELTVVLGKASFPLAEIVHLSMMYPMSHRVSLRVDDIE